MLPAAVTLNKFSLINLFDNKLNQAAIPEKVEEIMIIMKETPEFRAFGSCSSLLMIRKMGKRKMLFSPIASDRVKLVHGKFWIKPIDMIHEAFLKKCKIYEDCIAKPSENGDFNEPLLKQIKPDTDDEGKNL